MSEPPRSPFQEPADQRSDRQSDPQSDWQPDQPSDRGFARPSEPASGQPADQTVDIDDLDDQTRPVPADARMAFAVAATQRPAPENVERPPAPEADHRLVRSVAKGGSLNLLGAIVYGAANFLLLWVLNHSLGTTGAGVVLISIAIFNVASKTTELGSATGLIRWISRHRSLDDVHLLRATTVIALVPVLIFTTLVAALLWVAAPSIAALFDVGSSGDSVAAVLRAMAPFLVPAVLHSVLVQGTRGFDTMVPQVTIERIGRALLMPVVIAVAAAGGASLPMIGGLWAGTSLLALAFSIPAYAKLMRRATASVSDHRAPSRQLATEYWRFTGARAAGQTFEVVINWIDTLMVGAMITAASAGIYASGTRYVLFGVYASEALMQVAGPRVSGLVSRGDRRSASSMLRTVTGWQTAITWPIYLVVVFFAEQLLWVFGPDAVAATGALRALAIGLMAASLVGPASSVILMSGRSSVALMDTAIAISFNLVGNLIAIPRWGITGAGVVWALTMLLQSWLPAAQAASMVGVRTWGTQGISAAIGAFCTVGVISAASRLILGSTILGLSVAVLLGAATYVVVLWKLSDRLCLSQIVPGRPKNGRPSVRSSHD